MKVGVFSSSCLLEKVSFKKNFYHSLIWGGEGGGDVTTIETICLKDSPN